MRTIAQIVLGVCVLTLFSHAEVVGRVVDPDLRVIPGARVNLSCGRHTKHTSTDLAGEFSFVDLAPSGQCKLRVDFPGFAISTQALTNNQAPLQVTLRIKSDSQVVKVVDGDHDSREWSQWSTGMASVSDAELSTISNDTGEWIRYAERVAGAEIAPEAIYVDGLPSAALPPARMVARIDVNTSPFSPEYSDNERVHVNVITKNADRHVRFSMGGAGLGYGGASTLSPGLRSVAHGMNLNLSGPVPHAPSTFVVFNSFSGTKNQIPILAALSASTVSINPGYAWASSQNRSGQVTVHYSASEAFQSDASYWFSSFSGSNTGVGGLTLPAAGFASSSGSSETRVTFSRTAAHFLYRGGIVSDDSFLQSHANSSAQGITVLGSFIDGGASIASHFSHRFALTGKAVVESRSHQHPWMAGVSFTYSGISDVLVPNPDGILEFSDLDSYHASQSGEPAGVWYVTRGDGRAHYYESEAAPFMEGTILHSSHLSAVAGVRADYQTDAGIALSPRLSLAARASGFVLHAGGGVFVHDWPKNVMLNVIERDGSHLKEFFEEPFDPGKGTTFEQAPGSSVQSRFAQGLARPHDLVAKISIEHPLRQFHPGLEYSWTNGKHLLGSERDRSAEGWIDTLESGFSRRRYQIGAQLRFDSRMQSIGAQYQWVCSKDNTGGALSFPEYANNLPREWARTAGQPAHSLSLVDRLNLSRGISATLIETAHGSAPYNITSGLDNGDGLFNDRGGRSRNSGNGPRFNTTDLSASWRLPLPGFSDKREKRPHIIFGANLNNILASRNYTEIESVATSPLFGKPVSGSSGRSIRFWINSD